MILRPSILALGFLVQAAYEEVKPQPRNDYGGVNKAKHSQAERLSRPLSGGRNIDGGRWERGRDARNVHLA